MNISDYGPAQASMIVDERVQAMFKGYSVSPDSPYINSLKESLTSEYVDALTTGQVNKTKIISLSILLQTHESIANAEKIVFEKLKVNYKTLIKGIDDSKSLLFSFPKDILYFIFDFNYVVFNSSKLQLLNFDASCHLEVQNLRMRISAKYSNQLKALNI